MSLILSTGRPRSSDNRAAVRADAVVQWLLHHARWLDQARARLLGQDLAALDADAAEAVARTVEALAELRDEVPAAHLARLQGAVVAGFVEALAVRHACERARVSRLLTAAHQRELAALHGSLRTLQREALHDPLTGLPNRRYLARWLQARSTGRTTRVGVCVLDLDKFKRINDTLGHDAGDELLRVVSRRLATGVRPDASLLARYGGDEFVIVLANPGGAPEVVAAAEAALARVREPVPLAGRTVRVTCSVGVAVVDLGAGEPVDVVRVADSALYRAKSAGRNRWVLNGPSPVS